jgi:hypothetical protein
MPRQSMSNSELARYLERQNEFASRGDPFVLVVDVRCAPHLVPDQRRMVAEALDGLAEKFPNMLRGNAVVLSNAVQRGIVKVLSWLTKRPFPMESFSDVEAAVAWGTRLVSQPNPPPRRAFSLANGLRR